MFWLGQVVLHRGQRVLYAGFNQETPGLKVFLLKKGVLTEKYVKRSGALKPIMKDGKPYRGRFSSTLNAGFFGEIMLDKLKTRLWASLLELAMADLT